MAMPDHGKLRRVIAATGLAVVLSGCASPGTDMTARFFVAPDRFVLFNCEQIAGRAVGVVARIKQLQELSAKAGSGADGRVVSALVYEPELASLRGDTVELRKAAADRSCKPIPALEPAEGRRSDSAVR